MKTDKKLRSDHILILKLVGPGSRILDLGCGSGKLMETLSVKKGVDCTGIDRDLADGSGFQLLLHAPELGQIRTDIEI